jgi:protein-S-isoprenylcysteine O-methyltransferase Ste14
MNREAATRAGQRTNQAERGWLTFLRRHWQVLFNCYLCAVFSAWAGWQTHETWKAGRLNYVEVAFAVQNLVLVTVILIRMPHKAIDLNPWHQAVALFAFCSGMAFIGQPPSGGPVAAAASNALIFAANVLGTITLLSLGRMFGILIAYRGVETRGLYSVVRHPMYATDILLRIGYIVSHLNWLTVGLFAVSTACYVYRAVLEERFLVRQPGYAEYMARVRHRFIPGVF